MPSVSLFVGMTICLDVTKYASHKQYTVPIDARMTEHNIFRSLKPVIHAMKSTVMNAKNESIVMIVHVIEIARRISAQRPGKISMNGERKS